MMSSPKIATSKAGRGEWRISYDADGEILAIELWDSAGGTVRSYECLRIIH
jgi:hypothetical protein